MSVADRCGLAVSSPLLESAREAWRRWAGAASPFPVTAEVQDLDDLPAWTLRVTGARKGALFASVAPRPTPTQ